MIKSFKNKETEKIFNRLRSSKLPSEIQQIPLRKLRMINRVQNIQELRIPPANRWEKLKGDRLDQYSIRINNQWRICFEWRDNNAFNVEIVDYH